MFEVAFSFAGEQRHLVRPLAEALDERLPGLVFFDEWFEWFIAGTGGDTRLQDIYLKRSKMVVVCVSGQYGGKPWTRTEHDAIRALSMQLPWDSLRILPLRVGDGEVPGILFNTITLDARRSSVQSLCDQMIARLALIPVAAGAAMVEPRTAPVESPAGRLWTRVRRRLRVAISITVVIGSIAAAVSVSNLLRTPPQKEPGGPSELPTRATQSPAAVEMPPQPLPAGSAALPPRAAAEGRRTPEATAARPPVDESRSIAMDCSLGHAGAAINAVALTPDARHVVAATEDGKLRVWAADCTSAGSGSVLWQDASGAQAVAINGTGTRLAAAWSGDNLVRVFELPDGLRGPADRPRLLEGHPSSVASLAFGERGRLFSASDTVVQQWNAETGDGQPLALGSFRGEITSIVAGRSGGIVAASSSGGSIAVWDQGSPTPSRVLASSCGNVRSLAVARNGTLAAGCSNGEVVICAAGAFTCQVLAARDETAVPVGGSGVAVTALAFDAAGTALAIGGPRGTMTIRDVRSGAPLDSSDAHGAARVTAIEFSAVGRKLVSSDAVGMVRMWDLSRLR